MNNRIDELTRLLHADPENAMVRARLVAERKRVFGASNFGASPLCPAEILGFVMAGRAKFTLESLKSGKHLTFTVIQQTVKKLVDGVRKTIRLPFWRVSVMTGVCNDGNFEYLGSISGTDRSFMVSNKGRFTKIDPPALAFSYMFGFAKRETAAPSLRVWHHGECGCCARILTVPESVRAGLGPICAGRINGAKRARLKSHSKADQKNFERTFLALMGAA